MWQYVYCGACALMGWIACDLYAHHVSHGWVMVPLLIVYVLWTAVVAKANP